MRREFKIQNFHSSDAADCLELYRDTIRRVNCEDYAPEQINAWASDEIDVAQWSQRFVGKLAYVAVLEDKVVGFVDLRDDGYLDRLFVAADHLRLGIARALLETLLTEAHKRGITLLSTHASITAKPFFESQGFQALQAQTVDCRGVMMENFRMEKRLRPQT